MVNGLDSSNYIALGINFGILAISIATSFFLLFKIKFDDKNYRLLFVIYTLYWIAPMLLREYTAPMHQHMAQIDTGLGSIGWLPVVVYGIIGIFWKPLNDLLSYRLKSRKTVIYISLAIQAMGAIPMFAYPCLVTNIIQSITVGIGASGIAVFNLMFNEQYAKKKVFLTVSLIALPPLLAEFLSSVVQCCVTSFIPSDATAQQYIDIVKYLWIVGLACIVITAICAIFLKERREFLYQDNKYKEPVNNKWDVTVVLLVILATAITSFIKFSTSGSTAITELSYIGSDKNPIVAWRTETKAFEGYISVVFTVGQMAANIITGFILVKKMNKLTIFSIASAIWVVYAVLSASVLNVYARVILNVINGFAFGMAYNLLIGIVMNKFIVKTNKITPITLFNLGLSIGICSGQFFNTFLKRDIFKSVIEGGKPVLKLSWDEFVWINWIVIICVIATIIAMWGMFAGSYFITKKHPPKKILVKRVKNQQAMDD